MCWNYFQRRRNTPSQRDGHCNPEKGNYFQLLGSDSELTFREVGHLISLEVLVRFGFRKNWLGAFLSVITAEKDGCATRKTSLCKSRNKTRRLRRKAQNRPRVAEAGHLLPAKPSRRRGRVGCKARRLHSKTQSTARRHLERGGNRAPQRSLSDDPCGRGRRALSRPNLATSSSAQGHQKPKQCRTRGSRPSAFYGTRKCRGVAEISQFENVAEPP